jgi:hypothetical protein
MIDSTELIDEQWEGTEEEERDCYVSEVSLNNATVRMLIISLTTSIPN